MQCLVTGGGGFIGSNLVESLARRGDKVRVLDDFSTGNPANLEGLAGSIDTIRGDVRDPGLVRECMSSIEVVFHQAAVPSVQRSIEDPLTSTSVNVDGTVNVLKAAVEYGIKRFIYASSSSVYGDSAVLPKHEGLPPNPKSPYAVSKLAAENYCRVFAATYGLSTVSLRYFNVFGPRQDPRSQYAAVIPRFIQAIRNNEAPVVYGDGIQSRDFTYVENVVRANLLAIDVDCEPGVVFNCACNGQITLNELIKEINGILKRNIVPRYEQPRVGDIKHSFADISRIRTALGFEPTVGFAKGLSKTVDYYDR